MRYYTYGERVKESFDYLPDSLLGVNAEYWTQAEVRDLLAAHHRLYEYMVQRARKSSAFGATKVDFRILSRLTYAVPLVGTETFAALTEDLHIGEVCYTAFRTAVGSYPDFRDFAGMYAQGDHEIALVAARKLGTDTVRGLTHLFGNTNRNPKYLRRFVGRLPDELDDLAERFRVLQLGPHLVKELGTRREGRAAVACLADRGVGVVDEVHPGRGRQPARHRKRRRPPSPTMNGVLTCANTAAGGKRWVESAGSDSQLGALDSFHDTPLTCTNTDTVSSDASLNHWM